MLFLCMLGAATPTPASAQDGAREQTHEVTLGPDEQEARAHFQLADLQFRRGRFTEAAEAFERAFALSPRIELLYNIHLAYREAGDVERAVDALRRLLQVEELPPRLNQEQLEARLVTMERNLAERRELEARLRAQQQSQAQAPPAPPPAEPQSAQSAGTWTPGWIIAGAGGVLLVSGAITGAVALSLFDDVESRCTGRVCPRDTEGDRSTGQALTTTTDVLLPLGAAAAVTGVLLALLVEDEPSQEAFVACSSDACVLGAGARF